MSKMNAFKQEVKTNVTVMINENKRWEEFQLLLQSIKDKTSKHRMQNLLNLRLRRMTLKHREAILMMSKPIDQSLKDYRIQRVLRMKQKIDTDDRERKAMLLQK